ncbi:MAG: phosphotransferase family protein [Acidimicrobiia bacterium]|nr:phosphotransferase family protein [Acidimicrobiia bacterium]
MDQADRDWVEEVSGGTVAGLQRTAQGGSRATWLLDVERPGGERLGLVLRRDSGDGPFTGTELTLEREATVYRALAGTGVAVPRLVALSPDGQAMLTERVEGSDDFDAIADVDERDRVAASFVEELAVLHRVDPAALDLPGFPRSPTPRDAVLGDLDLWERVFEQRVRRPAPIVRFALGWARRNVPLSIDRTVLCWGDVGPGNFLHRDGRVSALLDWELAHLGDPMDDLAFFALRANLLFEGRFGDVDARLRRYAELVGAPLDPGRIRYYQPVVLTRWLVASLAGLDGRTEHTMPGITYLFLVVAVQKWLAEVLADLVGAPRQDVTDPDPTPTPDRDRSEVLELLMGDLTTAILPAVAGDPAAARRAMGMAVMLNHLQADDVLGPAVEEAGRDDLATVLGHRPDSVTAGLAQLDAVVAEAGPERDAELAAFFVRHAGRTGALWPAVAPYLAKRVDPVGT